MTEEVDALLKEQKNFLENKRNLEESYKKELDTSYSPLKTKILQIVVPFIEESLGSECDGRLKARVQVLSHVLYELIGSTEQSVVDLGIPFKNVLSFRESTIKKGNETPLLEPIKDD